MHRARIPIPGHSSRDALASLFAALAVFSTCARSSSNPGDGSGGILGAGGSALSAGGRTGGGAGGAFDNPSSLGGASGGAPGLGSGPPGSGGRSATGGTTSGVATASGGSGAGGGVSSGGTSGPATGGTISGGGTDQGGTAGAASGGTAATGGAGGATTGGAASGLGGGSGAGGGPAGGASGSGGAGGGSSAPGGSDGTDCTRELLQSTVSAYFAALAARSVATLPVDASVRFTENGSVLQLGTDGLWKTAGPVKYVHSALDTEGCNTASEAVVPDGTLDIPFALRLKLRARKITEIETIAVRPGDYKMGGASFPSDPNAIIQSAASVGWETPVPAGQRSSRTELVAWMDKYFRIFPAGVCETDSSCRRLENGGGSFSCSAGASCQPGTPSGTPAIQSHIIFADVETGIGVGFAHFMGNADMHMFKRYGGKTYAVHAILGAAASTGWD